MSTHEIHPKWWQLYFIFPLLIILFVLDHRLNISTRVHQVVQFGIILLVYGIVYRWLKANANAVSRMDQSQQHRRTISTRNFPGQMPDPNSNERQMLHLLDSEIGSALSNTIEIDYFDVKSILIDDVPQESSKD